MFNFIKIFFVFLIIFLALSSFFTLYGKQNQDEYIGVEKLIGYIQDEKINKIEIRSEKLDIYTKDEGKKVVKKEFGESFSQLVNNLGINKEKLAKIDVQVKNDEGMDYWLGVILPIIAPVLFIVFLIFLTMRGVQGVNSRAMGFGQMQPKQFNKDSKDKTTFKDVAGAREAKEELKEIVEFLKNPEKFTKLGARIPRGVLLLGSPGTGKTLLARATAGEAGVAFFHISGSEFVEMFVGVGASRVRSLFQNAKKNTPCIIFVDEIDAVGRKRGSGMGGSHDEREQTLNQILVEMDGFDPRTNIIVMAATNRADVLDPALLRPGRFDRQIVLDEPDIEAREEILKIHAEKKPLDKDVKLRRVAERTPGFSGADLANVLNEAAILTARKDKQMITDIELFESIEKVMLGPERKSRIISEKEKRITAYHEAGHAVVAHFSPHSDAVHKISIISRGHAGGYTLKLPSEDKHMHTKTEFTEEISVLLGGYLTEKEIFGEATTGATSDLRRATALSRKLVMDYGMSENMGLRTFRDKEEYSLFGGSVNQRNYSEKVAEEIDKEILNIINQATQSTKKIIKRERKKIDLVVEYLMEKETMEKEKFEELMGEKEGIKKESV